jgi:hypothetical protein
MLAHSFSVSKFPSKPKPSVGKQQLMAETIEAASQFIFSHLDEPCLVGTFSAREYGSRKIAYNRAYYYQEKLETYIAMILNYHADAYPITWNFHWNKSKNQYEVRVMAQYRPEVAYNESDPAPYVQSVEEKQVNALKSAMDSIFFGGQVPRPS